MKSLIYYTRSRFTEIEHLPGVKHWLTIYNVMPAGGSFVDRTNSIQLPVRTTTKACNALPLPQPGFNLSFRDVALLRAQEIYKKHQTLGVPIRVAWSGGIDSTAIITAFIELLGIEKARESLEILMTANSIIENPWVFERIIRKEKFKIVNMMHAANIINRSCITVNGEGGDQVHGTDAYRLLIRYFGTSAYSTNWTEDNIIGFIAARSPTATKESIEILAQALIKIVRSAPIELVTLTDFWWWMNFCCKWSTITYRILARTPETVTQEYLDNFYFPFYGSKEFQLWSMHRQDEAHSGDWQTYKWAAKKFSVDSLNVPEFNNKHRQGSLYAVMSQTHKALAIDEDYNFYTKFDPEDWYNPNNSFI